MSIKWGFQVGGASTRCCHRIDSLVRALIKKIDILSPPLRGEEGARFQRRARLVRAIQRDGTENWEAAAFTWQDSEVGSSRSAPRRI